MAIGKLVRDLRKQEPAAALAALQSDHGLDKLAAANLLSYLDEQYAAAGAIPDDRTIVIERSRDDLGDWRVACLSPASAAACTRRGRWPPPRGIRDEAGVDVEVMWSGRWVRDPVSGWRAPPDTSLLLPDPMKSSGSVVRQLGSTRCSPARFREDRRDARCFLPRRRPGARAPLWQLRKRASGSAWRWRRDRIVPDHSRDLSRCLPRHLRSAALTDICRRVRSRSLRVVNVESQKPSPFSASLLFGYVANYIYDGDAPLAERRAQALSVDQSQLRDLIGDTELRDLLDESVLDTLEQELQHLPARFHARSTDAVPRSAAAPRRSDARGNRGAQRCRRRRVRDRRARQDARRLRVRIAGEQRFIAVEDAARYRDAIGVPLPPGLPVDAARAGRRSGRRSGAPLRPHAWPVHQQGHQRALGLGVAVIDAALQRLMASGRVSTANSGPAARPRMVRRRSAAHGAAAIARAAAPGSRAGGIDGARTFPGRLALARAAAIRPRRLARRDRTAAGRADRGVGARHRDPSRPRSRLLTARCSIRCSAPAK
jgi:ATP-dependent Lhr-like helicase